MSAAIHVVCQHCNALNRIPQERLNQAPKCGKCKSPLLEANPFNLTTDSLQRQISQTELPLLVDFWAEWCGPCKAMAPAFAEAAKQLAPGVRLAKVNTEQEQATAAKWGIRSIPTMILFQNGREVARQSGATNSAGIVHWVQSQLR